MNFGIHPNYQSTITVPMTAYACPRCGVYFAMPTELADNHRKHGRRFCCPNGHRMVLLKADDVAAKLARGRDEVLRLHEQEQAEARDRDACPGAGQDPEPQPPAPPPAGQEDPDCTPAELSREGGRVRCSCGMSYLRTACLGNHLRRRHRWAQEQVVAAIRGLRAGQEAN